MTGILIAIAVFSLLYLAGWYFGNRNRNAAKQRQAEEVHDAWGMAIEKSRPWPVYHSLLTRRNESGGDYYVDENTWHDLDLYGVFEELDRTLTSAGECELYCLLRNIQIDEGVLADRDRTISFLENNAETRRRLREILINLGRESLLIGVLELMWDDIPSRGSLPALATVFSKVGTISLVAVILSFSLGQAWTPIAFGLLLSVYVFNTWVHYKTRSQHGPKFSAIGYLGKLVEAALEIGNLNVPEIESDTRPLKTAQDCFRLPGHARALIPFRGGLSEGLEIVQHYVAILFLTEAKGIYRSLDVIEKHQQQLRNAFKDIGCLDAAQAVASFRTGLPVYCKPTFVSDPKCLSVTDLFHPLVNNAVSNSISLKEKGCFVLGANMSGKSTFLRTMGINTILAQTLFTCLASEYTASKFHVVTAINTTDDLGEGMSLFATQAKRLLSIIESAETTKSSTLCIIDEILNTTNNKERICAAEQILDYLARKNGLVIVSTHDLDLVRYLDRQYEKFHFQYTVKDKTLVFDYLIRSGFSDSTNAIKILSQLGYPDEIVSKTKFKIASLSGQGGSDSFPD